MKDRFPETLALEIDRQLLRKYLRLKSILMCQCVMGLLGFPAGMALMEDALKKDGTTLLERLGLIALGIGLGQLGALLLTSLLYLILMHRQTGQYADGLEVRVEGAFLRVCAPVVFAGRRDRKLHFRSIIDYTVVEGPLMRRLGIMGLQINTAGQNLHQNVILIPAIKNALATRDLLAEIDAAREQGHHVA